MNKKEVAALVSLLVVFQSFFGIPDHCSLNSSLTFSLDSGVDCAAQSLRDRNSEIEVKRRFKIQRTFEDFSHMTSKRG